MQTTYEPKRHKAIFFIIALSVFSMYSCSSNSDDTVIEPDGGENPDPEIPVEDKVRTLVANFGANDGVSVDGDGIIYASNFGDFMGTQVLKVNPQSTVVEVAVDGLQAPTGNLLDSSGNTLVVHNARPVEPNSDRLIGDVLKIDADGNRTTFATIPGFPSGIATDENSNVYVSNFAFPGVHQIDSNGEVRIYVQDSRLAGGVGIAFDDDGNLFVGNFITGDILRIGVDKSVEVLATIPTIRQAVVIGYITYLDGAIYATAVGEHVIYKVSLSGESSIFAGSGEKDTTNGSLLGASFDTPNGIAADANRNVLYVTELGGALRSIDVN